MQDATRKRGPKPKVRRPCEVEGCESLQRGNQFCGKHGIRFKKYGDPLKMLRVPNGAMAREFERLVLVETDDCVEWTGSTSGGGYGHINTKNGYRQTHRLALLAFAGEPPESGMVAAHGPCHNPLCMNARGGHVRWQTETQNAFDKRRDGTHRQGEDNGPAVLTEEQVIMVRSSGCTNAELGRLLNVHRSTISAIRRRRSWTHI